MMKQQKQIPTLRQLCDEFTARQVERGHDDGTALIQSAVKEGNELVVELIDNDTTPETCGEQGFRALPMADTMRLNCSQVTRERLFRRFNQETTAIDVSFDPHHPSAQQPIFSHKRGVHSCHGVTGTYQGSPSLGYVEHALNPDRTIDNKSLRLRFLPDENGDTKKPVFINYATARLAAEALKDLTETARKNRQAQTSGQSHTNKTMPRKAPEPDMVAGLRRFLG